MNNVKNRKIYLNYAGLGTLEKSDYLTLRKFLDEYFSVGPPEVIEKYREYINKLRKEISLLLNCTEKEIIYTKNTTEGVIIASEALPLVRGDEVLLLENEYAANKVPWLKKKKDGLEIKVVNNTNTKEAFNTLLKQISPKTKTIAISSVQYYDGYQCDLKLLSDICRTKGIFLVVDGIQEVGTRVIDLQKTPIDILLCGGHKHLNSIVGVGFMYISKEIMHRLKDTKVGIRSVKAMNNDGYILKDDAGRFEDGTPNLFGILSLYLSVKRINEIGIVKIEKRNLLLLLNLKTQLRHNHIPFINYQTQGNLIALKISNPSGLYQFLRSNSIYVKRIKDIVRVSISHRSSIKDFEYFIKKTREWLNQATPS